MKWMCFILIFILSACGEYPVDPDAPTAIREGNSVARLWNEALLEAIRNDYARPTVHARNLYHTSAAMFDAWRLFSSPLSAAHIWQNSPDTLACQTVVATPEKTYLNEELAISYAAYTLMAHRFNFSPKRTRIFEHLDGLMAVLDFERHRERPAAQLGIAIGQCYIDFGLTDGANEFDGYMNQYYTPINPPLEPKLPGNPSVVDPNRWQVLQLDSFIDQSGNPVTDAVEFLSPEWGNVTPFALTADMKTHFVRDGAEYPVYFDPASPPYIEDMDEAYQWHFALVARWSSHLDATDPTMIDISPSALGNLDFSQLPTTLEEYKAFYQPDGGDASQGYALNPITNQPYPPQRVPRGDYARVLAEFWADGPDSETPPGHWFVILNTVMDNPLFERKWLGKGEPVSNLEWDIKAYFTLGGAMHDAAISAWSIKGWYDYARPISAIRYLTDLGQSTDSTAENYHEHGIPQFTNLAEIDNSVGKNSSKCYFLLSYN